MAKTSANNQLSLNDGAGGQLPIQTGTWVTKAIDMMEQRRLSITLGVQGSTASGTVVPGSGGFTGILSVQGTDEIANCMGSTGTQQAGAGAQPGQNGFTGALYWNNIQSGTIGITPSTTSIQLIFNDFGPRWVRVVFNSTTAGVYSASNVPSGAGGTGTMQLFYTSKST